MLTAEAAALPPWAEGGGLSDREGRVVMGAGAEIRETADGSFPIEIAA